MDNALRRVTSMISKISRLRNRFMRELESTANFLKYHFNQRQLFDKHIQSIADLNNGDKNHEVINLKKQN